VTPAPGRAEKRGGGQSNRRAPPAKEETAMLLNHPRPQGRLLLLAPDKIDPSPWQARTAFDAQALDALTESIRQNGLLQPVTVRRAEDRYQLIAGERRLRACIAAGLDKVPALLYDSDDAKTAALGLLENIQRQDLNPFEQARGIRDVIALWWCSQAEAAKRLGMAQPTLANKLRLLQLTDAQQALVLKSGLTERHARAALRLPPASREKALCAMAARRMTARAADSYVESLLNRRPRPRRTAMVRDVRIFLNTIDHAIKLMTDSGVPASATAREQDGYIEYTVRIPTGPAAAL
jgi:ParB family chromosome partitioning protein